ncbi:MAG: extracellular solute-binding protein [Treponema sp.]|nr:extracellular solute-binding protein [Treponema sp.]
MNKIKTLLVSSLAALSIFTACSKSNEKVVVEIWHTYNGSQQDYLNQAAEKFNASQEKYEVKVLAQDYSGFADTVYNAVANKIGPSIIFNYGSTAVDYAKEGLAVDISKYIAEDVKKGDTAMQDIIASLPASMQTDVKGFEDGGIYYLPGCTTGPVFFYNKEIFDELGLNPPKDWDELAAISKTIYEAKGIPGFHSDGLVDNIQMMIMQNGLGYIDVDKKEVAFDSDGLAEIYQWYADCCSKGYFEFNTIGKYASEDLATGAIAAFSGSCVNDQYITMLTGELGIAPWISTSNGRSFYTGWNRGPIFLTRNAKVDRGAYEFAKFFLSPEVNGGWAKANSALSPYGTTEKDEDYKAYINNLPSSSALPCVLANLPVSGSFPNVHGGSQVRNILVEYLNNVVDGKMTAKDAAAAVVKDCNEALAD